MVLSLPRTFWNRWEILVQIFKALSYLCMILDGMFPFTPFYARLRLLTTSLSFLGAMSTFVFGKLP